MKNPSTAIGAVSRFTQRLIQTLSKPGIPVRSPLLAPQAGRLRRSVHRFSSSFLRLLARYREDVVEEQMKLNRIAECAISLYTAAAVLSKIDGRLHSGDGAQAPSNRETETARFYCDFALDKLDGSLDRLFVRNRDRETGALSDILTGTGQ